MFYRPVATTPLYLLSPVKPSLSQSLATNVVKMFLVYISRSRFVTIFTIIVTIFVRISNTNIQWLLDFGYELVIPWLLRGISEHNTLTFGLHPRNTGVLFQYTLSTHGITITNTIADFLSRRKCIAQK